jgi:hypothetical protein
MRSLVGVWRGVVMLLRGSSFDLFFPWVGSVGFVWDLGWTRRLGIVFGLVGLDWVRLHMISACCIFRVHGRTRLWNIRAPSYAGIT